MVAAANIQGDRSNRRAIAAGALCVLLCAPVPALAGPRFRLHDTRGRTVTEADLRGGWRLVFFGYTFCPDVCPTALAAVSAALPRLQQGTATGGVFVTVDPRRDSAKVLATYISSFDKRILALRGDDAETAAAAKAFGAQYSVSGSGEDYSVSHSGWLYVVDPDGRLVRPIRFDASPDEIVAVVDRLKRAEAGR